MNDQASVYIPKNQRYPHLTGLLFRIFVNFLETPVIRSIIAKKLFKDAGINKFRLAAISNDPTYKPLVFDEFMKPEFTNLQAITYKKHENSFSFPSISELNKKFVAGEQSPLDLATQTITKIKQSISDSPALNAFIESNSEDILRQAEDATKRFIENKSLGLLDGIPVAIKDEINVKGYPTTVGTKFLGDYPEAHDSTVVARLRAAGAIIIGKTNMHEIGFSPTGLNPHHGFPRNPYNPKCYTGGSSSGSAAAVASGICPVAIGADGGGSIRVPASLCGLVGLKATYGRVSEFGAFPLDWSLAHIGPIAAHTQDALLVYNCIAGKDPLDPHTLYQPDPHISSVEKIAQMKIGIYSPWFDHCNSEVKSVCHEEIDRLKNYGIRIKEVTIPDLDLARVAQLITIASEMAQSMDKFYKKHQTDFGLDVRSNLAFAQMFTSRDYIKAQRLRTRLIENFKSLFKQVDVIATPTAAVTAPSIPQKAIPFGESNMDLLTQLMRYTNIANLTGLPAITTPCGYDQNGMPIGIQFMAPWWHEELLFHISLATESHLSKRKPKVFYN